MGRLKLHSFLKIRGELLLNKILYGLSGENMKIKSTEKETKKADGFVDLSKTPKTRNPFG